MTPLMKTKETAPKRTDNTYCQSECGICEDRLQDDLRRYNENVELARQNAQAAFTAAREAAERAGTAFTILGRPLDYWSRLDNLVRTERPDLARKAESPPQEYLFLGGPAHGQRKAAEWETYKVPVPTPFTLADWTWNPNMYPEPIKTAIYRRRQVAIADRTETVYTYEGTN